MLKAIGKISKRNDEANKLLSEFRKIDETLDNAEVVGTKTDGTKYDFHRFLFPLTFIEKIHNYENTLYKARNYQTELRILINKLNNDYNPRNSEKANKKNNVLESARKLLDGRKYIIVFFKKGTFLYKDNVFKTKKKELEEESEEESENESKNINYDLFKDYFNSVVPSAFPKKLYEAKNNKDNELVELIKARWNNLKDEIKEMSENETKNEKLNQILEIVNEILDFNKTIQKQQVLGLKILTPNQMLSRLPICLAQLKAGNNSEKLKNEIRKLLYSLYR